MNKQATELAAKLEAVVGSVNVTGDPALGIDGLVPSLLVKPASTPEVVACMQACSEANAAVIVAGNGTWPEGGNPPRRADVVLGLDRMTRMIEFSAPDLVAIAEAGMPLAEFAAAVGREGLWLPLDPPGAGAASIGAIVACNSSGALRCGMGTPRDYVIGLRLVHADGSETRSGGRVAKNVAGYDLNKLYVGSFGTLAVITEVTVKLRPLPEKSVTVAVTPKQPERLTALLRQVRASELQPAAFVLTSMLFEEHFGADHVFETLLLRFADNDAAVNYQVDWLRRACAGRYLWIEASGEAEAGLWSQVNDIDRRAGNAVRISVPISQAVSVYERILDERETEVSADLGSGIVRAAWDSTDDVAADIIRYRRAEAEQDGGKLFVEKAPPAVRRLVGAWGPVGSGEGLMKAIKEKFDPGGVLNPGRFVAGI